MRERVEHEYYFVLSHPITFLSVLTTKSCVNRFFLFSDKFVNSNLKRKNKNRENNFPSYWSLIEHICLLRVVGVEVEKFLASCSCESRRHSLGRTGPGNVNHSSRSESGPWYIESDEDDTQESGNSSENPKITGKGKLGEWRVWENGRTVQVRSSFLPGELCVNCHHDAANRHDDEPLDEAHEESNTNSKLNLLFFSSIVFKFYYCNMCEVQVKEEKSPIIDSSEPILSKSDLFSLSFPQKVFYILEHENSAIVRWSDRGYCFRIIDYSAFVDQVLPKYFASKYPQIHI